MISHFAVNWLAVILATVASMALGFVWYMGLSRQWMAASGRTPEDVQGGDVTPFIWSAIVQLVIAYFLALLTPALTGSINVGNGLIVAAHMWFGFVLTSMIMNHRYQGKPWSLTVIDGGYLLVAMLLQGVVIGLFG